MFGNLPLVKPKAALSLCWIFACLCSAFSSPTRITPADFAGAKQPQIAVNTQGKIFVTFGRTNSIYLVTSENGGESFTAPQKIGDVDKLALGMRRGPRIATANNSVMITGISHGDGNLYGWFSRNAGKNWSRPLTINSATNSAREGMHALASDGKTRLFSVWLDLRNGKTELWGAASTDGGKTWSANHQIYRSPDETICECCHPSAIFTPQGELVVMWRNWLKGNRDMYRTISTDGGKTFAPATKMGIGSWPLQGCPMDGGHIAASTTDITHVWRREQRLFITDDTNAERELAVGGTQPIVIGTPRGFEFIWQSQGNLYAKSASDPAPKLLATEAGYAAAIWSPIRQKVFAVWEETSGIYFTELP